MSSREGGRDEGQYWRVVKGFGLYHIVSALPLALPVLSGYTLDLMGTLHEALSLPGAWPTFDPTALLFMNLFATLAVFWGLFRFRHASRMVGQYEGWAMVVFALIVLWYVWQGASLLWLIIALVDGIGAVLHLRAGKR